MRPDDTDCVLRLLKNAELQLLIVVTLDQVDLRVSELIKKILHETKTVHFVVISNTAESVDLSEIAFELKVLKPIERARMFYELTKA